MQPKGHYFYRHQVPKEKVLTEKMETYSIAKPRKRINRVKRVVGQKKEDIMKKELPSPVELLVDETKGSEIPKVDDNEVYFEEMDEQSFDQKSDTKIDKKVNVGTKANILTATGRNCSRQLLEHENKIKFLRSVEFTITLYVQSFDQKSDTKIDKKVNVVTEANILTVRGRNCSR